MGRPSLTKYEASLALAFLRRVVARGADEERDLVAIVEKLERIAATTYNERQSSSV
jgi:hypothetical protein